MHPMDILKMPEGNRRKNCIWKKNSIFDMPISAPFDLGPESVPLVSCIADAQLLNDSRVEVLSPRIVGQMRPVIIGFRTYPPGS